MNEKDIEFATAQLILSSMLREKKLVIVDNPLHQIKRTCDYLESHPQSRYTTAQLVLSLLTNEPDKDKIDDSIDKISELCQKTKDVVRGYTQGIPEDLPIHVSQEVAEEAFLHSAKNDWYRKAKSLTAEAKKKIVKSIYSRLPKSLQKDYIRKELISAPDDFLLELNNLTDRQLKSRVQEWTSEELEGLFERVGVKGSDIFLEDYKDQEKNENVKRMRIKQARSINKEFIKRGHGPETGLGSKYDAKSKSERYKYVRNVILPGIVWNLNKERTVDDINRESNMYSLYYKRVRNKEL